MPRNKTEPQPREQVSCRLIPVGRALKIEVDRVGRYSFIDPIAPEIMDATEFGSAPWSATV
jgi:hypothetical protein